MIVLNLFAEPSAGKSTGAAFIFSHLKMNGVNAELIPEYAKELAWEKRLPPHRADYWYITAQQAHRLWRVDEQVDVAIVDSPLPLGLVYGSIKDDAYRRYVMDLYNKYNNINYFIQRDPNKEFRQEGRHVTFETAKKLSHIIKETMEEQNIPYKIAGGTVEGYNYILDATLHTLGVKRKI